MLHTVYILKFFDIIEDRRTLIVILVRIAELYDVVEAIFYWDLVNYRKTGQVDAIFKWSL